MGSGSTRSVPLARRLLASASLAAAAVPFLSLAGWDRAVLGFVALVGAGAIALGRRSVLAQVVGRGIAWVVLTPLLLVLGDSLWHGHLPEARALFIGAASAAALLLARPALHGTEAQAEFAPVRYRRLFLAGAVSSVTGGTAAALFAAEALRWGEVGIGLPLAALAAALLTSTVGVTRMRSWGVLLGMATSVVTLAGALLSGNENVALALALAAVPGVLLASPLVAARLGRDRGGQRLAPAAPTLDVAPPARVRIATGPDDEEVTSEVELHEVAPASAGTR